VLLAPHKNINIANVRCERQSRAH